jgi:hypothetical protein
VPLPNGPSSQDRVFCSSGTPSSWQISTAGSPCGPKWPGPDSPPVGRRVEATIAAQSCGPADGCEVPWSRKVSAPVAPSKLPVSGRLYVPGPGFVQVQG